MFIQQTMRVAQADQELIIKQRISILGCQIWSGFVFWWERWEQPEAFFWNIVWCMVSTMFLISSPNIRKGQPRCLDGSKLQSHHQGLLPWTAARILYQGVCQGVLPWVFTVQKHAQNCARGLCQGVTPHFLMFFTQISKSRYILVGICSPGQEPCSTEIWMVKPSRC